MQAIIRKGIIHLEAENQWLEEVMDDIRAKHRGAMPLLPNRRDSARYRPSGGLSVRRVLSRLCYFARFQDVENLQGLVPHGPQVVALGDLDQHLVGGGVLDGRLLGELFDGKAKRVAEIVVRLGRVLLVVHERERLHHLVVRVLADEPEGIGGFRFHDGFVIDRMTRIEGVLCLRPCPAARAFRRPSAGPPGNC